MTLSKESMHGEDVEIEAHDLLIRLRIKRENLNESDCSITMFMFPDGEMPLSGEIDEDSAKPVSNRAVQMISSIQDYKGDYDESKRHKKHESLGISPHSKDSDFKSMKTTEFVLKEIRERKEQDISLDEGQNDGMRSPIQESTNAKEVKGYAGKTAKKMLATPSQDMSVDGKALPKTPDLELNHFDSFQTRFDVKPNATEVHPEPDEYDDFERDQSGLKSRVSLISDKI